MTLFSPNKIISSPSSSQQVNGSNSSSLPSLTFLSLDKPTTPDNGSSNQDINIPTNMIGSEYLMLEKIGQGSFSQVHLAQHISDSSPKYAVKIIKKADISLEPPSPTSSKFVADPDIEISCLKRAQGHPNIVRLHCVSSSNNHLFLVQEFVPGGDLFDEIVRTWQARGGSINNGALGEPLAVKYFLDLLSAVEHLHKLGIAHRDIKSENIFLTKDKAKIQLGDFGFATDHNVSFTRCGTLDYVAPEVLESKETGTGFDPKKADLWSCVVVLFAMLTARLPFDADNKADVMAGIRSRKLAKFPPWILSDDAYNFFMWVFLAPTENRPTIAQMREHQFLRKHSRHMAIMNAPWAPKAFETCRNLTSA